MYRTFICNEEITMQFNYSHSKTCMLSTILPAEYLHRIVELFPPFQVILNGILVLHITCSKYHCLKSQFILYLVLFN